MVYLSYLESIGQWPIDRALKIQQAANHISNAANEYFDPYRYFPEIQTYMENQMGKYYSSLFQEYITVSFNTLAFALILYFVASTFLYVFFFKLKKKKYLPNFDGDLKIGFDIKITMINIFVESWLVAVLRMFIPRYSYVYYDIGEYSLWVIPLSIVLHLIYDETMTYWAHRIMHTSPWMYEKLHYLHHRSLDISPFSGFAFHPFDAFLQALGGFTSCYWFPIHINIMLGFNLLTTLWAMSIHDNVPLVPCKLFLYSTHHTIHHEIGRGSMSNYGKFTSVWDRIMGSYCDPDRIDFGWQEQKNRQDMFKLINQLYGKIVKDTSSFILPKGNNKKKIT